MRQPGGCKGERPRNQEDARPEYHSSTKFNIVVVSDCVMAEALNGWKEEGTGGYTNAHICASIVAVRLMAHQGVWTMQELEPARHSILLLDDG